MKAFLAALIVAATATTAAAHTLSTGYVELTADGHAVAGPPWEVYVTDPGEVPDPAAWRTEVVHPIREASRRPPPAPTAAEAYDRKS